MRRRAAARVRAQTELSSPASKKKDEQASPSIVRDEEFNSPTPNEEKYLKQTSTVPGSPKEKKVIKGSLQVDARELFMVAQYL